MKQGKPRHAPVSVAPIYTLSKALNHTPIPCFPPPSSSLYFPHLLTFSNSHFLFLHSSQVLPLAYSLLHTTLSSKSPSRLLHPPFYIPSLPPPLSLLHTQSPSHLPMSELTVTPSISLPPAAFCPLFLPQLQWPRPHGTQSRYHAFIQVYGLTVE